MILCNCNSIAFPCFLMNKVITAASEPEKSRLKKPDLNYEMKSNVTVNFHFL